ncbi:ABC transporter ATP-binding protein [Bacillus thuringiensis]|uniref:ABC transporter ATP-binding protein n=1 Tax=Bacillus thuringiensis TaxID=1428 RepID=A0ABD6S6E6_BACTU|nr:ABC transporter ATP-binding protein [Bacillus thuringiensis]PER53037.1 ABC transporter ATP-binding protein [Bacillus thuringiensis]PEU94163.1 ABC transporter ATP-binding protein [Bacillus thuringiensis]PFI07058.1 ABC transporter ATP-binding protein [Bacillus thuringiensis]PFW32297.1 ABC transporter ATP-binding protein [Bacillus thuringiensis]PGY78163.1 ABC transporter ATP-binding protein [Bacillus thuringiensis]
MIEVIKVKKTYKTRNKQVEVLNNISFNIGKGEVVGLLGINGAGKTTLIKCLCGLIETNEGDIRINGISVTHKNKKALKHISSVLEGNRNLYWRLTVKENIEYFLGNRGISHGHIQSRIDYFLERFQLYEKKNELVKNLSRGMQQKVAIIIALMADTEILLLDEPTLGLDVESNNEIRTFLKEIVNTENKTILISSHDMNLIQKLCDRVVIISNGRIITNDTVLNLMNLFQVKSYQFITSIHLKETYRQTLYKLNDSIHIIEKDGKDIIKVTISSNDDFYSIMNYLKQFDIEIESIEKDQVNFEEVFLKLIKGEVAYGSI